jgi:DNA-binding response OmpR family regulator
MRKHKILLVDDEPQMVDLISYSLQAEDFEVITAYNGEEALRKVESESPDLLVLDIMLPGIDGFEVCRQIRSHTTIPVLMLTAKKGEIDIISGLELGADDYVTKPFSHRELILRVKVILRRTGFSYSGNTIKVRDLSVDFLRNKVFLHDLEVNLTPTEFKLLTSLINNAGRVLTWEALLKEVWGSDINIREAGRDLVKVTIHRLRNKIEPDPDKPEYVTSVRGIGYRFRDIFI